jgi:hypothetical protein
MYIQHNIVEHSHNDCCHGNATMHSLCIVIGLSPMYDNQLNQLLLQKCKTESPSHHR